MTCKTLNTSLKVALSMTNHTACPTQPSFQNPRKIPVLPPYHLDPLSSPLASHISHIKLGYNTVCVVLQALPLGVARSRGGFLIGCSNSTMQCYSFKGKRTFCINLPSPILAMHGLETAQQRIAKCIVVSLANGIYCLCFLWHIEIHACNQ